MASALGVVHARAEADPSLASQWEAYRAVAAKTILDLQPFRRSETGQLASGDPVELTALAPGANAWFLLRLGAGDAGQVFHLENADPQGQTVALAPGPVLALTTQGATTTCAPWEGDPSPLAEARDQGQPYAPLCDGRLYLRNPARGARSWRESVTDFLRDNIWGGDAAVQFIKDTFYQDAFAEADPTTDGAGTGTGMAGPSAAALSDRAAATPDIATGIGLGLAGTQPGNMAMGQWYRVAGVPGVFASAIRPGALSAQVLSGPGTVNPLDAAEAGATDYLVAFDLDAFELGFALGTDHPRVDWSPRPPASVRPPGLPGPDGIADWAPLQRLGMISPTLSARTVATFAAGFKRQHGAFKWGPFSTVSGGSHYGFVEQGVVFSKLQPGLATLMVFDDGRIEMRTWAEADEALLPDLRFARQNGVALIEPDPATGKGVPGPYVAQWGAGNWSGSAEAKLRTLRAGACLIDDGAKRYLVYGYFSTAPPSSMARVFLAYSCSYAMLLDMNAPELTYMAVYAQNGNQIHVEHLVPDMAASDETGAEGQLLPRFLGFPDSRDFFYLLRKRGP